MLTVDFVKMADLKELAVIFEELVEEKTDLVKMAENFVHMEKNKDYIVLGARENGRIVGSVMGIICLDIVGECKPFMVIENVIVASEHRGKGIGKIMMAELEKLARERNCNYTMFVSGKQRVDAHKFYEAVGYRLDLVQGFKKFL